MAAASNLNMTLECNDVIRLWGMLFFIGLQFMLFRIYVYTIYVSTIPRLCRTDTTLSGAGLDLLEDEGVFRADELLVSFEPETCN